MTTDVAESPDSQPDELEPDQMNRDQMKQRGPGRTVEKPLRRRWYSRTWELLSVAMVLLICAGSAYGMRRAGAFNELRARNCQFEFRIPTSLRRLSEQHPVLPAVLGFVRQITVKPWPCGNNKYRTKTSEIAALLSAFPELQELDLHGPLIADRDLAVIARLPQLRKLALTGDQITDAGLAHLTQLRYLEELTIPGAQISDEGLLQLSRLSRLTYLDISQSHVTDGGIDRLRAAIGHPLEVSDD